MCGSVLCVDLCVCVSVRVCHDCCVCLCWHFVFVFTYWLQVGPLQAPDTLYAATSAALYNVHAFPACVQYENENRNSVYSMHTNQSQQYTDQKQKTKSRLPHPYDSS